MGKNFCWEDAVDDDSGLSEDFVSSCGASVFCGVPSWLLTTVSSGWMPSITSEIVSPIEEVSSVMREALSSVVLLELTSSSGGQTGSVGWLPPRTRTDGPEWTESTEASEFGDQVLSVLSLWTLLTAGLPSWDKQLRIVDNGKECLILSFTVKPVFLILFLGNGVRGQEDFLDLILSFPLFCFPKTISFLFGVNFISKPLRIITPGIYFSAEPGHLCLKKRFSPVPGVIGESVLVWTFGVLGELVLELFCWTGGVLGPFLVLQTQWF